MREVVVTHAVRTAIGNLGGTLKDVDPDILCSFVFTDLMKRSGIDPSLVDHVIMGQTKPSTCPMNVARCGWLQAGLPSEVPASTLIRACCSGSQAIFDGVLLVASGDADIVVAGGVDSQSQSIYNLRGARNGVGNKNAVFVDALSENNVGHAPNSISMGMAAELVAEKYNVSRADQDALALLSNQRALAAIKGGAFAEQIVAVNGFSVDEHPRVTSIEALSRLKASFKQDGTVTAGNSSGRNDAASCVLLMSSEMAKRLGCIPTMRHVATATIALEPEWMLMGPSIAVPKALDKAQLSLKDIDYIEFNEAFASQTLACLRILAEKYGESEESLLNRTNLYGSGISMGHPPGATGAIMTTKLLYEMKRRPNIKYGMVTMCVGGGHGFATIWGSCNGGKKNEA